MKTCKTCGLTKDESEFRPTTTKRGNYVWTGLKPHCRECERASWRKPREELKLNMPFTDPSSGRRVKRCTRCQQVFPAEAFSTPGRKGALRGRCRPCETANQREWRAANPDKVDRYWRTQMERHPEQIKQRLESWRARNRAHVDDYQRTYNETHREQKRAYYRAAWATLPPEERKTRTRRWYESSRERGVQQARYELTKKRIRERARTLYRKHPEKKKEAEMIRRARKYRAPGIERISITTIVKRDGSVCYLCGKALSRREITLDHVVPLARGGSHKADNLRVACRSCNSRKGTRLLHELGLVVSG